MPAQKVKTAWTQALKRMKNPPIALLFAVARVQVFKNSSLNRMGYASMPLSILDLPRRIVVALQAVGRAMGMVSACLIFPGVF